MINNQPDEIDNQIMMLLQKDSRMSHKELAHLVHKSVTAIHVRVRRLIADGYIKNYTIIVDNKKIGRGQIAYTQVQIKQHTQERLMAFQNEVIKLPEVMECCHMTGAFDFLLRIAIKDMDEYNSLLVNKLSLLPDVGTMQTFFVLSEAKHETAFPISANL
jgi:DNA-binding Lrp family transcriptional regulator